MQSKFIILIVLNFNRAWCHYGGMATTTKTYDLQVPGSDPIRIIEAEPLWDRDPQDQIAPTTKRFREDFEHRALRPSMIKATQPIHNLNIPYTYNDDNEAEDASVPDSSEELKRFLKGYAERFRRPVVEEHNDDDSSERFHRIELITKPSEEPANRLANLHLEEKATKPKGWNMLTSGRLKPLGDEKAGWVSLEVVPWSVSKVAKWHSALPMAAQDEDRYYNAPPAPMQKPIWNQTKKPAPVVSFRPGNANYYAKPFVYANPTPDRRPDVKPVSPQPLYPDKGVYTPQEYSEEIPRPPWNTNDKNCDQNYDPHYDPNCESELPGIITDGLPPNFPRPHIDNNRRKGSLQEDAQHPASHPFNGDGEWILLTTTKGYKAPNLNNRQRSLDVDSHSEVDKESISTHKSVRLTVLPPLKDSKINMTTSHGGLLQVESTFETVEEAQQMALKKQNMKRRPIKRRRPVQQQQEQNQQHEQPQSQPPQQHQANSQPTHQSSLNRPLANSILPSALGKKKKSPNSSTLMAAVGAGMIPATMAMLVPMMGRRRRRDLIFSSRSPDVVEFKYRPLHFS